MDKTKVIISAIVIFIILIGAGVWAAISIISSSNNTNNNSNNTNTSNNNLPTTTNTIMPTQTSSNIVPADSDYKVTLETDAGKIVLQLSKNTPITTGNFVGLADKGFYNNVIFHRAISGFMIQGGDPTGTGSGGPGYKFNDETFTGEYTRGTVAMANAGANTNGSQFFIMHQDNALPKNYVIFGKVIEGLDVVDKIATAPVKANSFGEMSSPVTPVKILSTKVEKL